MTEKRRCPCDRCDHATADCTLMKKCKPYRIYFKTVWRNIQCGAGVAVVRQEQERKRRQHLRELYRDAVPWRFDG